MIGITDKVYLAKAKELGIQIADESVFLCGVADALKAGEPNEWEEWLRELVECYPSEFGVTR